MDHTTNIFTEDKNVKEQEQTEINNNKKKISYYDSFKKNMSEFYNDISYVIKNVPFLN